MKTTKLEIGKWLDLALWAMPATAILIMVTWQWWFCPMLTLNFR